MVRNICFYDDNHSAMCDHGWAIPATVGSSHDTISSALQVQSHEMDVCNPCYLFTCITGDALLRGLSWLLRWESFFHWYPRGLLYRISLLTVALLTLLPCNNSPSCSGCSTPKKYTPRDMATAAIFSFSSIFQAWYGFAEVGIKLRRYYSLKGGAGCRESLNNLRIIKGPVVKRETSLIQSRLGSASAYSWLIWWFLPYDKLSYVTRQGLWIPYIWMIHDEFRSLDHHENGESSSGRI